MTRRNLIYRINGQGKSNIDLIKEAIDHAAEIPDENARKLYLEIIKNEFETQHMTQKSKLLIPVFIVGTVLILVFILVSIFSPPTIQENFNLYKAILGIACAGVAGAIPGFLSIKYKGIIQGTGAMAAFVAILIFIKPNENTFNVRVVVNADNNFKIQNQDKVILYLGLEPREANLHSNNDGLFENIPIKYLNTKCKFGIKFSEKYVLANPDSLYTLVGDKIIYLNSTLQLNTKIAGVVLYRNNPLQGVVVSIDELRDTTDNSGFYNLTLDPKGLKAEQIITFYKPKFKLIRKPISLITVSNLDIVMSK